MQELSNSDRTDIKKLLNIQVEGLGELDIIQDEDVDSVQSSSLRNALQFQEDEIPSFIPAGQRGRDMVARIPSVFRIEKKLRGNLEVLPDGVPLKTQMSQMSVKQRNAEYIARLEKLYAQSIQQVKSIYNRLSQSPAAVDADEIRGIVREYLEVFIKDRCILLNISNHRYNEDEHLYKHALNVCLLSLNIAASCGFSERQVVEAGEAGMLSDIGMMNIPLTVRQKPEKLTEEEFALMQKHVLYGTAILEKVLHLPVPVVAATFQHHERNSGAGYIRQRKGHLIHRYAKIVAIADVYTALCNDRTHRKGRSPFSAAGLVLKMANANLLEGEMVRNFITFLSLYPVGSFVQLTDGRHAKIVEANNQQVSQPIVSIYTDKDGKKLLRSKIYQLDLSRNKFVRIARALDVRLDDEEMMFAMSA